MHQSVESPLKPLIIYELDVFLCKKHYTESRGENILFIYFFYIQATCSKQNIFYCNLIVVMAGSWLIVVVHLLVSLLVC